ncbi:hypothetical protein F4805DRAFT_402803 [Annulohypoxylon moriforme]|nr:hypothetical protein F4805DRAFT_402803 [Annulohypoxylon moriforme]
MPQYKFIEAETQSGKLSKPTSSIRSHAIRAGLRKSVNPPKAKGSLLSRGAGGDLVSLPIKGVNYRDSDSVLNISVQSVPILSGRVDPFNCFPIPTNLATDHLVRYLITKFDFNSATADHRKSWFPYALQNAPMMHSTLAMTAALWRAEYPALEHSIRIEGIRQKGEAMRLTRAYLDLVDSAADGDEFTFIMSTISTLVIIEVLDGDFEAAEMHLRGVHHLFSMRGGRDSFRDAWVFCKSTNLADIQVAVALGRQVIFPGLHQDQTRLPASIISDAQHPPLNHSITDGGTYECAAIFTQLRQLSLARQSSMVSFETQRTLLNVTDEIILQYLYQDRPDNASDPGSSHALVLAAHIFMYVTLRQVPPRSPQIRRICVRLLGMVGIGPPAERTWVKNKAALLWIAFVGLLGTGERVETCPLGQSFVHIFRSAIREYPRDFLHGTSNLYKMLSTFLWDESYCQPLLAWLGDR